MLKKLLIAMLLCVSSQAFAEGVLQLAQPVWSTGSPNDPQFSLYVHEPLAGDLEYKSWTGFQSSMQRWTGQPDNSGLPVNNWFYTTQAVMYNVSPTVSIGMGPSYGQSPLYNNDNFQVKAILEIKLW